MSDDRYQGRWNSDDDPWHYLIEGDRAYVVGPGGEREFVLGLTAALGHIQTGKWRRCDEHGKRIEVKP